MARLFGQAPPLFDESTTPVFGGGGVAGVGSVGAGWPAGGVDGVVVVPASVLGLFVVLVAVCHHRARRLSSLSVDDTASSSAGLPTDTTSSSAVPHPTPTSAAHRSPLAETAKTDRFPNPRNMITSPAHPSVILRMGKPHATREPRGRAAEHFNPVTSRRRTFRRSPVGDGPDIRG